MKVKKICAPILAMLLVYTLAACGSSGDVSGLSGTYNARYDENNPHEVVALIDASITFDGAGGIVFEDSKLKLTGTYKQTSGGYEITFEEIEADAALVVGAENLSDQTMTVKVGSDGGLTVQESCTHLSFDEAEFYKDGAVSQTTVSASAANSTSNTAPNESAQTVDDIVNAAQEIPANAEVVYSGEDYIITKKELFSHHAARSDYGDYTPVAMPGSGYYYSNGLLCIISNIERLYGYADKNGDLVIPCQYEEAKYFSEGLAAVKTYNEWTGGYSWGFINTAGELVIPAEYDAVNSFSEGMAAVSKGEEWGYIDTTGNEVIPFGKYLGVGVAGQGYVAHDFHDGLAYTEYVNGDGSRYSCFIDKTGDIAIDFKALSEKGYYGAWDFNEGLARVGDPNGGGVYGYVDTGGNIVIELPGDIKSQILKTVPDFYEGYAVIRMPSGESFVIDGTGSTVFSLEGKDMDFSGQDSQGFFRVSEGLIPVKASASEKYGFVDTSGEVVIPFVFDFQQRGFSCGLSATTYGAAQTGYVDKAGNVILSLPVSQGGAVHYGDFYEDSAIVFIGESNGMTTTCLFEIVRK